ncbi:Rho termination factor N-terminal domain-containing protein, partial [Georgenia sp. 10Sc9-8]|nr:Rho termination factor N-terminal domain-containing protein [Georgenia halotolerans]
MTETVDAGQGSRGTGARTPGGSLTTMRLPELQALAAQLGLKGTGRMRKGDLIAAIQARREAGNGPSDAHQAGDGATPAADTPRRSDVPAVDTARPTDAPAGPTADEDRTAPEPGGEAGETTDERPAGQRTRRSRRAVAPAGQATPEGATSAEEDAKEQLKRELRARTNAARGSDTDRDGEDDRARRALDA